MFVLIFASLLLFGLCHNVSTQCSSSGRFANEITEDCRGYTTCIATGPSSYYQYDLACPPNFIYNHYDSQCTNATTYHCFPNHNCTELGALPYEGSEDCNSFIVCVKSLTGLTARLIDCPPDNVFSPIVNLCVNTTQYQCPKTLTTAAPVSSAMPGMTDSSDGTTKNTNGHNSALSKCTFGLFSYVVLFIFTCIF